MFSPDLSHWRHISSLRSNIQGILDLPGSALEALRLGYIEPDIARLSTAAILAMYYPRLRMPSLQETSIEASYRLILSPNRYATWFHSIDAVRSEDGQVVEL